jgi:hypothetical protein
MGSASVLLASSGMLPDDLCASCKPTNVCALHDDQLCSRLAGNMPARASRMLAPPFVQLLTPSRHRDDELAVLLGHEVFGAAG